MGSLLDALAQKFYQLIMNHDLFSSYHDQSFCSSFFHSQTWDFLVTFWRKKLNFHPFLFLFLQDLVKEIGRWKDRRRNGTYILGYAPANNYTDEIMMVFHQSLLKYKLPLRHGKCQKVCKKNLPHVFALTPSTPLTLRMSSKGSE